MYRSMNEVTALLELKKRMSVTFAPDEIFSKAFFVMSLLSVTASDHAWELWLLHLWACVIIHLHFSPHKLWKSFIDFLEGKFVFQNSAKSLSKVHKYNYRRLLIKMLSVVTRFMALNSLFSLFMVWNESSASWLVRMEQEDKLQLVCNSGCV